MSRTETDSVAEAVERLLNDLGNGLGGRRRKKTTGGQVLVAYAIWIPALVWWGFVLSKLWGWFVAPLGPPEIGVAAAFGLALFVRLSAGFGRESTREGWAWVLEIVARGVASPALFLLLGWVATKFV